MAASPLKQYIDRSFGLLKRNTAKVMKMEITPRPPPIQIFSFNGTTSEDGRINQPESFAVGSDSDIGGLSTCKLSLIPEKAGESSSYSHAAFHGNLSLIIPPAYSGKIRTGYAAFRNKTRPTIFGEDTWDLSLYSHLRVVVGYRGVDWWRDKWVMNIQTDGPVRSDLYQHRLPLVSSPNFSSSILTNPNSPPFPTFSTLHLPLSSFVLTNSGQTSSNQIAMLRSKVRTIGFALLGGGRSGDTAPISQNQGGSSSSEALADGMRRLGAGGWSGTRGGEPVEMDAELEELIRSDMPVSTTSGASDSRISRPPPVISSSGSGYHRVGASNIPTPPSELRRSEPQDQEVTSSETQNEGYYELCIKSVEAVQWDPEAEDIAEIA